MWSLCEDMAFASKTVESDLGLYIHIPFCERKCPYCDFNSYAGQERLFRPLASALVQEIEWVGAVYGYPDTVTIYIGGGTPTVLPTELLANVLAACRRAFRIASDAEITCEANPGTVDQSRFSALRRMGVNRLSMGVQSFNDDELRFLGRIHTASEAEAAFAAARQAGFDNINLDLIFGLPGQAETTWMRTLERAILLEPEHLSLYALSVEPGTPLAAWVSSGWVPPPDDDLAADLYELAMDQLEAAGYVQYEISNWARQGGGGRLWMCRHNLIYWHNRAWLGFGPGAHSSLGGRRWANVLSPNEYIARIQASRSPVDWHEEIGPRLSMGETMMLGLRLVREGVRAAEFKRRYGQPLEAVFGEEVDELVRLRLLEHVNDAVRLTRWGRLLGNQVFMHFLPDE